MDDARFTQCNLIMISNKKALPGGENRKNSIFKTEKTTDVTRLRQN